MTALFRNVCQGLKRKLRSNCIKLIKVTLRKSSYKGCEWNAIKTGRDIQVIRSQIKYYQNAIEQSETGTVLIVGDGIARVSGLTNCMSGELLEFEDGTFGMAQNLEENSVSVVLFGSDQGSVKDRLLSVQER